MKCEMHKGEKELLVSMNTTPPIYVVATLEATEHLQEFRSAII